MVQLFVGELFHVVRLPSWATHFFSYSTLFPAGINEIMECTTFALIASYDSFWYDISNSISPRFTQSSETLIGTG